ncbi:class I SAM-dependent methyltransferase [Xenorhabdus sp. Vera]|uniref:class I SAM-dependent DNA methyltransferase n=1 Tax=Xenorhabdus koppenhoeferi TaxID=351659 RepID=UPI0019AEF162|nr:class I SAM-dependent methyltransferase [Xenorhabdus sp. Vera]MBD2812669.1 class I SAM-dependent methyltransferase [Xenorhabdus sp. Vera]
MQIKDTSYEPIAERYNSFSDKGPLRILEMRTILDLAGDIQGKSVLDLACGTGYFGLQFKKLGASEVVGVDISEKMIEIAKEESQKQGADIKFHVRNISEMESFGKFDIIVAGWLFCNAESIEELDAMFRVAADNLKPSGKLVAYTIEPDYRLDKRNNYRPYEVDILSETPWKGGFRYEAEFITDPPSPLIFYGWGREYYESAMNKTGFKRFEWRKPMLIESDIKRYPAGFWDVHQKNCWETGFICEF